MSDFRAGDFFLEIFKISRILDRILAFLKRAVVISPNIGYFQAANGPIEAIDGRLYFGQFWHAHIMRYTEAMRHTETARYYVAIFLVLAAFGIPSVVSRFPTQTDIVVKIFADGARAIAETIAEAGSQLAAIILSHNPKSVSDIKSHYDNQAMTPQISPTKVRVLIVPGHEPSFGGAEYGSLKERNMTVELGQNLQTFLQNDGHYQTFITRDASQWSPTFVSYFDSEWDQIISWQKTYKQAMSQLVSLGSTILPKSSVGHAFAPDDVATRLYGITKWANENNIDITIHIHFNDYPGRGNNSPGKYSGLAVYVPVAQYENSTTTHAIADTIFKRLAKYNPVSDLPGESSGVVDDSELIAVGANDTADSASMLIEYAYIYEPQFNDPDTRSLAIKDLAYQTYLGLEDFFNARRAATLGPLYDTVVLPYYWKNPISATDTVNTDIFALQTALSLDGEYPPPDKSKNDCPRTGKIGSCTKAALSVFQGKYGITGEDGVVGPKTLHVLNRQYGGQFI